MEQKVVVDILKKVTLPHLNQELLELEREFQITIEALQKNFTDEFLQVCLDLKKLQHKKILGKAAYLGFILLRTELLEKNFRYKVVAYDKEWLLKDGLEIGWIDVSFIYKYLEHVWKHVSLESKKYVGKFSEPQIELIISTLLCYFHEYAVLYFRAGINEGILTEEFNTVEKEKNFCIYTGELYEKIDIVWKENREEKSLYDVKLLIEEKQRLEFFDFKGLELKNIDFSLMELSYADFSQMDLVDLSYTNNQLRGARFVNSTLRNVNFMGSNIEEADFRQAVLTDVNFTFCECLRGTGDKSNWKKAGYLTSKFEGARLSHVNFTSTHLQQIDFSKAILSEVNFNGAILEKCIFHAKQLEGIMLSDKQKQEVVIVI